VTLIDRAHYDTLIDHHVSAPDEKVWGAAYHIPASHEAEVRAYLDIREINGYSIQYTHFYPSSETTNAPSQSQSEFDLDKIYCLVYIGLPENPQFLGPQDPQALAAHILQSRGPSGENREYLYMLEEALGELSKDSRDGHVSDLARRCRGIEAKEEWRFEDEKEDERNGIGHVLHKVGSTEEQEEIEKEG
jgi:glutathione-specific gamma-glutamylcyclotransferase